MRGPGEPRNRTRSAAAATGSAARAGRPTNRHPGRPVTLGAASPSGPERNSARLSRVLFPDGEPPLPDTLQEHYDRMDLRHAIGVLMGNRDLTRRLAAEAGVPTTG